MAIKEVIIHVVKRDKNGEEITTNLRNSVNTIEGLTTKLTDDLLDLFSSATLNFGEFGLNGDNTVEPALEQKLNNYFNDEFRCSNFVEFTKELSNSYKQTITNVSNAKGGYLVFYQYEYRRCDWLAIAVLQRNSGVDVSDANNDVIPSNILDLNKLHLGAAINLTLWKTGLNSRYIKFKTGLAKEVREYFEDFIGCQRDKEAAKIETRNLRNAIRQHANDLGLNSEEVQEKLDTTMNTIKATRKGEPILLSTIANAVFPSSPQDFITKAKDNFSVSEELIIDNTELGRFNRLTGRTTKISVSFDRKMLGDGVRFEAANQDVDGDEAQDKLVITSIPITLKRAILEELQFRENDSESQSNE